MSLSIFDGLIIAVDFSSNFNYRKKQELKNTIISNGGTISGIITKKCKYLVVTDAEKAQISSKSRIALKFNIPIVSVTFIEACLQEGRVVDAQHHEVVNNMTVQMLQRGVIQSLGSSEAPKKRCTVVKEWKEDDQDVPYCQYQPDSYDLVHYCILEGEEKVVNRKPRKPFTIIELHATALRVSKGSDGGGVLFKLITKTGFVDPVEQSCTDKRTTLKFTEDIETAVQLFNHALKKHQLNASCNTPTNKLPLPSVASPLLSHELGVAELTAETSLLVGSLLRDSQMECQSTLSCHVDSLKLFMVERAEVALLELSQLLKRGCSEAIQDALQEFYKNIPHLHQETSVDKKFLVTKLQLCQLLKDMLRVSESTSFERSPQITSLYHSLNCNIMLLPTNAKMYKSVKNHISKYKGDTIVLGGCQIDKALLQVKGIYKIERQEERNWKYEPHTEYHNTNYNSGDDSGCDDDAGSGEDEDNDDDDDGPRDGDSVCGDDRGSLMFHGTKASNVLGVLSRGLMQGREVVDELGGVLTDEGNLGNGIYFSKDPVTSLLYSDGSCDGDDDVYNVFVCQVALGKVFETKQLLIGAKEPPTGFNSIKGVVAHDSVFKHEEYAIYTPERQRLCYLLQFSVPKNNKNNNNNKNNDDLIIMGEEEDKDDDVKFYSAKQEEDLLRYAEDLLKVNDPDKKGPIKKEVKGGLMTSHGDVPLKSQHVIASVVDLVAQVVIIQEYINDQRDVADGEGNIEAKFVFPLDEKASVCGFEAFINDKHVIAEVQEKQQAHRVYKEAVSKGHGAYLMDQQEEDDSVFVISVGNLPPKCNALIKITYVTELQTNDEHIDLHIPNNMTPNKGFCLSQLAPSQDTTESQWTSSTSLINTSIQVSIEMPSLIKNIISPTHVIRTKKTDTMAVVQTAKNVTMCQGFELQIYPSEVHVPRMWVEKKEEDEDDRACMLAFYPEFESAHTSTQHHTILIIDSSTSMHTTQLFTHVLRVAHLMINNLPNDAPFNVVLFGSRHVSMHLGTQYKNENSSVQVVHFLLKNSQPMGSSNLSRVLHKLSYVISSCTDIFLLSDGYVDNVAEVLRQVKSLPQQTRVFTMGLGDPCNTHVLKLISHQARGCFERLPPSHPDLWTERVQEQLERGRQAGLGDVRIEWQNFNEVAGVQAPHNINVVFSGHRQVVYGFVPDCTMATLKAKVNGKEVSIVVSTSELCITTGNLLHKLTAKALIDDWTDGLLLEDSVLDQVMKKNHKRKIIELSTKHSIITKLTSFVAVEQRNQGETFKMTDKDDLLTSTSVDLLPYMKFDPVICKVPLLSTQHEERDVEVDSDLSSNQFFAVVADTLDKRAVLWLLKQGEMVVERRRLEEVVWDLYGELQRGILYVPTNIDTKYLYFSNDDDLDTEEKIRSYLDKNWSTLDSDHIACLSDLEKHYGRWAVDMVYDDLKRKYKKMHMEKVVRSLEGPGILCILDTEMHRKSDFGGIEFDLEGFSATQDEDESTSSDGSTSDEEDSQESDSTSSNSNEEMEESEEMGIEKFSGEINEGFSGSVKSQHDHQFLDRDQFKAKQRGLKIDGFAEKREEVEEAGEIEDDSDGLVEGDDEYLCSDWTDVKMRKKSSKLHPIKNKASFSKAYIKKVSSVNKPDPKPIALSRIPARVTYSAAQPKRLKAACSLPPKQAKMNDDAHQNNFNQHVSSQPSVHSEPSNLMLFGSAPQPRESRLEEIRSEPLKAPAPAIMHASPPGSSASMPLLGATRTFVEPDGRKNVEPRTMGFGSMKFSPKPQLLKSVFIEPPSFPMQSCLTAAPLPHMMASPPMNFNNSNNINNNTRDNINSYCDFFGVSERKGKIKNDFVVDPEARKQKMSRAKPPLKLGQDGGVELSSGQEQPCMTFSEECSVKSYALPPPIIRAPPPVVNILREKEVSKSVSKKCVASKPSQQNKSNYSIIRRSMLKEAKAIFSKLCSLSHECKDKMGLYWELNEELLALLKNPMNCLMIKQEIIQRCLVPCGPDSIIEVFRMTANLLVLQRFVHMFYKVRVNIDPFDLDDSDAEYDFEDGKAVDLDALWRLVSVDADRKDTLTMLQQLRDYFKDVDQQPIIAAYHYACAISDKCKGLFKPFSYDVEEYMGSHVLRISIDY